MKKVISLIMVSMMAFVGLVGCGSSENEVIDVNKKADEIMAVMNFEDDMISLNDEQVKYYYTSVDLNDIVSYKIYLASSSAKAEEIAIFETKDDGAAKRVVEAVNERNEDLLFGFKDYQAAEYKTAQNSYITSKGKYVFFIVGKNVEEGKKELK